MNQAATAQPTPAPEPTTLGHPSGLFTLFFAEMWERFSYYGMRALLTFYMIKGFLGLNDSKAYGIYGAYTALVYMTPYFGGMLADRVLGQRLAVILGGLLMAAGHLFMTVENEQIFFLALALLIAGNGFFKPNISTMVGQLYERHPERKDAGFTIFYMGINLGAAMSPVLCGYIGETYGWHYGFGLATIGMLVGVAVFAAPSRVTQILIGLASLAAAATMFFTWDTTLQLAMRIFLGAALLTAAAVAVAALQRGRLPKRVGAQPARGRRKIFGLLREDHAVLVGTIIAVPLLAVVVQRNEVAGWVLSVTGIIGLLYVFYQAFFRSTRIERDRLMVVTVLLFFSLLFWAFFEQAGTSLNNFTDRNVDRVFETRTITKADVGKTIVFRVPIATGDADLEKLPALTQAQLGHVNADPRWKEQVRAALRWQEQEAAYKKKEEFDEKKFDEYAELVLKDDVFRLNALSALRECTMTAKRCARAAEDSSECNELDRAAAKVCSARFPWKVVEENVGMGVGGAEIPASEFQAVNPIYILLFGLVFSALWAFLAARGRDPSTPVKFALGVAQLGLGFGAFWYGAQHADSHGMVGMGWLLLGYLLITTGELSLSPVGLSMVTKLSPARLASSIMGVWFLATAFSNYLASMIAQLTGIGEHAEGGAAGVAARVVPPPSETVHLYGDVFGQIAIAAFVSAAICFVLAPWLHQWMHEEEPEGSAARSTHG